MTLARTRINTVDVAPSAIFGIARKTLTFAPTVALPTVSSKLPLSFWMTPPSALPSVVHVPPVTPSVICPAV